MDAAEHKAAGPRELLQAARRLAHLTRLRLLSTEPQQASQAGMALLTSCAERLVPGYVLGDYGKVWFDDEGFIGRFWQLEDVRLSAERKFMLAQLLRLVTDIPGDTAEAGVLNGTSSWFICDHFAGSGKTHYAIDSFAGLSKPDPIDGSAWRSGDMQGDEARVRELLRSYDAVVAKGWIPDAFAAVASSQFCFVHIDVDLYRPTRDTLEFFYPRLAPGGLIVCDDYGFTTCPGARRAMDEYLEDKPEPIVEAPTGQGFLIKRNAHV